MHYHKHVLVFSLSLSLISIPLLYSDFTENILTSHNFHPLFVSCINDTLITDDKTYQDHSMWQQHFLVPSYVSDILAVAYIHLFSKDSDHYLARNLKIKTFS